MMIVAFYKGRRTGWKGLWDALVRGITHGAYSHCELVFPAGVWYSSSASDGGCRFKQIASDPEKWDFLAVAVDESRVRRFCDREVGCGYDWFGVARFVIPWLRQSRERWFCSEVVLAGLQQGGLFPGVDAWRITPVLLYGMLAPVAVAVGATP